MNNFLLTIGIEVHTSLKTKTKMFSSALNCHNSKPNTNINEIDLGLPGILPSPNKKAVIMGIRLAKALQMEISEVLAFDRKNYFYQDLPKGFQITQQYHPIGINGKISISKKAIDVERIHLEEDTAKQMSRENVIFLDYNRAGIPLIEIVSKPVINSASEAIEYLTELKRILTFLDISDGKMEDGSLRVDLNVSVAPIGLNKLGTKVEIKNINSFANVAKAIDFEFKRQTQLSLRGIEVQQETRRWDETCNQTVFMRAKSEAIDYRYFCEPNILSAPLEREFVNSALEKTEQIPSVIRSDLIEKGVNPKIIDQLLDDVELYKIFSEVLEQIGNIELAVTWVIVELVALSKREGKTVVDIDPKFVKRMIEMLIHLKEEKINSKQAKTIFEKMYSDDKDCLAVIKEFGLEQITDIEQISTMLQKLIKNNPDMVSQYGERPERVEKYLIGMLMKETKGQANPSIAMSALKNLLKK